MTTPGGCSGRRLLAAAGWLCASILLLAHGACLFSTDDASQPVFLQGQVRASDGAAVAGAAVSLVYELEPLADPAKLGRTPWPGALDLPDSTVVLRSEIFDFMRRSVRLLIADSTRTRGAAWDGMDDDGNPVPNGLYYWKLVSRDEGGGKKTQEERLFILGSTPEFLLQHKHTLSDATGGYRIPRALLPLGEIISVYDTEGTYGGEFRVVPTIQVHALRQEGESIQSAAAVVNMELLAPSESVDLVFP